MTPEKAQALGLVRASSTLEENARLRAENVRLRAQAAALRAEIAAFTAYAVRAEKLLLEQCPDKGQEVPS